VIKSRRFNYNVSNNDVKTVSHSVAVLRVKQVETTSEKTRDIGP